MKRMVFLSCGDLSGDRWASQIIRFLQERFPDVRVTALGGRESEKAGAHLLADTVSHSIVGLWEALHALSFWRRVWHESCAFLRREKPSVCLAIDNPGFNLRLVRQCARWGVPVVYFAPPQVWAWGRWRGKVLARFADYVLHLFPWEGEYFAGGRAKVSWVGHPLRASMGESIALRSPSPRVILFLPGSRRSEVSAFLSVLRIFLVRYGEHFRRYRLVSVAASPSLRPLLEEVGRDFSIEVVDWEQFYPLLQDTVLAVSCSGTVTLEVALGGVPQIIVYRTSWATFYLGKFLFRSPFIGLPNILLGQEVARELVQGRFTPRELFRAMQCLLSDPLALSRAREWAHRVAERLGDGKTFERVVEVMSYYLQ